MSEACAAFARRIAGDAAAAGKDWASTVAALAKAGAVLVFEDDGDGEPLTPPREQVTRMMALAKAPAGADAWFDGRKHDGYTTWAIQRELGKALSAHKTAAIQLDLKDESRFAMTVVPWKALDGIKALARAAGGRIISRSPPRPLAKPMPAAKPPPANLKRLRVKGSHLSSRRGDGDGIVVTDGDGRNTMQIAVTAWPPVQARLFDFYAECLGFTRDGRCIGWGTRGGTALPYEERERAFAFAEGPALPPLPDDVMPERLGLLAETVVVLPTEGSYHGDVKRPLALRGKTWAELDVPAAVVAKPTQEDRFPAFAVQGFAHTADRDVLLWQKGGYTMEGKKLVRTFDIGACSPYDELSNVPDGDGFFLCTREQIVEVRAGARPKSRLPGFRISRIAAGLDGAVVASIVRTKASHPALLVWWPAERTYAKVPGKHFGLRGTDDFDEHGVCAASRLAWGYESLSEDLRAVAWESIAKLPRIAE